MNTAERSAERSRISPLRIGWEARRDLVNHVDRRDWRLGAVQRAALAWQSAWFSFNDRLQEQAYAEQLQNVRDAAAPVFVLGFWRSGTTLLHELLCCDPRFGYPTTSQCMNPSTMLLTRPPGRASTTIARPMDGMPISPESPQEDEFALLALGLPSAYRLLLTPKDVDGALHALDPDEWSAEERERWIGGFARFVRRLRLRDSRPLVFKSPTHSYRAPLLRSMWPQARFVTIHREPVAVWHSNLRLWRVLCDEYALTRWDDADIERFVAAAYRLFSRKLAATRAALAESSRTECSFEDLIANPIAELERIYERLGLAADDRVRAGWGNYLASRADHRQRRYEATEADRRSILRQLGLTAT